MNKRFDSMAEQFKKLFGLSPTVCASAPGRTELGGNHTDHQHGRALAAAIDLRAYCVAAPSGSDEICVMSEGHRPARIKADDLAPKAEERDRSVSLVRGIVAGLKARGVQVGGFYAYTTNDIPSGGGLSSSAAFEVMIAAAACRLFGAELDPVELAIIGQRAENDYYGKPCGLMDQIACAAGGAVALDFADPTNPGVSRLAFYPGAFGYDLVITGCGASHADLTADFAAIPQEMGAVAAMLGKTVLRDVDENAFYARLGEIRSALGDRAALRAMHFFDEDRRAAQEAQAIQSGDFDRFLSLVAESGRSSWMYLQNISPAGADRRQPMALTLALSAQLLGGRGALRIQGGGFAGMMQAYVPTEMTADYVRGMEQLCGEGSCRVLHAGVEGVFSKYFH